MILRVDDYYKSDNKSLRTKTQCLILGTCLQYNISYELLQNLLQYSYKLLMHFLRSIFSLGWLNAYHVQVLNYLSLLFVL